MNDAGRQVMEYPQEFYESPDEIDVWAEDNSFPVICHGCKAQVPSDETYYEHGEGYLCESCTWYVSGYRDEMIRRYEEHIYGNQTYEQTKGGL